MAGVKSSVEAVAKRVAGITGFHKDHCTEVLQAAFRVFGDILVEQGEFRIRGFCHFKLRIAPERTRKFLIKSFDEVTIPEQVYVRVEVSDIVTKMVNKKFNDKDTTYKDELREKTRYYYEMSLEAERIRRLKAANKRKYSQEFVEKRMEASGQILLESLRIAMPNATEEERTAAALAATENLINSENRTTKEFRDRDDERLRGVQKRYHAWMARYASPGHGSNTGKTNEYFANLEKAKDENTETGV